MKFWPLVWSNLRRKKFRTLFTFLSIFIAFVLFGYLAAINMAFRMGVDVAGADRLLMTHKVSIIQPLPISYQTRIASIPSVTEVTHSSWFGGIYQDPKNFFGQFPVEPEDYLRMYPEFVLPEEQKKAWFANRTGAIAGRATADRFGWKVGDRIPLQATVWRKKDGTSGWEFVLEGIYEGAEDGVDNSQFLFHYDYFDEARLYGQGWVGWYIIRINDPGQTAQIADRIDREFRNSPSETKTASEKAFVQAFANQMGNIGAIIGAILTAVFFTILLVAGNTMAQSVRERINELAVLKTLGFSNGRVLGLVLAESLVLAGTGGLLGLGLSWWLIRQGDPTPGFLPAFFLPPADLALGFAFVAALGLAAGILPAVRAMRLQIVDALRRT